MRALIAMSGGVDSSVAAVLMREAGYDCAGVTMRLLGHEFDRESGCCSLDDAEDARSVAYKLGMPFYVFNFSDDFRREVIERFVESYERGETPNPCVECNRHLKFDRLWRLAETLGLDCLVTGHYARIEPWERDENLLVLKKGLDERRDQSYFLYMLTSEQLKRVRFPLGALSKDEVREIAEQHGLVNARKRDSQDICFVENGKYAEFIEGFRGKPLTPGEIVDSSGKVLGRHSGTERYTVGQRRGLGVSAAEPLYVVAISAKDNRVVLGPESELYSDELTARELSFAVPVEINKPLECKAKIRYRHTEQSATAVIADDGNMTVKFALPQRAITPGQAVVLYDGDTVLGGGTIV